MLLLTGDVDLLTLKSYAQQVEEDFKTYLKESSIPYYVNAYLRQKGQEIGNTYRPPFILGGGSLPWLK